MLGHLLERLGILQGKIRRGQSVNVNDRQTKDDIVSLATSYFSEHQDQVVKAVGQTEELLGVDQLWQELLILAQGNNSRKTYIKGLGVLKRKLSRLNVACLSRVSSKGIHGTSFSDLSEAENSSLKRWIATFRQLLLRTDREFSTCKPMDGCRTAEPPPNSEKPCGRR